MSIENRKQYIRTQLNRWQFYMTLEELKDNPPTDPELDPKFAEVYANAIRSVIEELEADIEAWEAQ